MVGEIIFDPKTHKGPKFPKGTKAGDLLYKIRWQKHADLTWENANVGTWKRSKLVNDWEYAKQTCARTGEAWLPRVLCLLDASAGGVKVTLDAVPMPPTPSSRAAESQQEHAAAQATAEFERQQQLRDAKAAADKVNNVPWAIRFAVQAAAPTAAAAVDLHQLASRPYSQGPGILKELAAATCPSRINEISSSNRAVLPRLRVLRREEGEWVVYQAVVGRAAQEEPFKILRYDGPYRQKCAHCRTHTATVLQQASECFANLTLSQSRLAVRQ